MGNNNAVLERALFNDIMNDFREKYKMIANGEIDPEEAAKIISEYRELFSLKDSEQFKKKKAELVKKQEAERQRLEKEAQEQAAIHVAEVTSMELPMDWDNIFLEDERTQGVHTDSIPDALILSLTTLGKVDIEYMASITGQDYKTVISALKGSIYQNPEKWGECFFKGWEFVDEYLSGNLMRKLKIARSANEEYKGYFADNIAALEKVLPPEVSTDDIYITIGSPWIPADIIDSFITHLFGEPTYVYDYRTGFYKNSDPVYRTIHDEVSGTWEIPYKTRYCHNVAVKNTYGTEKMEALHILERTLNMKSAIVKDEVVNPKDPKKVKRVINHSETTAALEKQKKLIEEFHKWVWSDEDRKTRLRQIFEEQYCCIRGRRFNGSFLTFPDLASDIELLPYQKNAVARIIFSPNTLLAHNVGAGKTYVMIAAGMELKRMGLSKKNMYVVPNNIVGQWKDIFMTMYPNARLLCVDPKAFTPTKRKAVLEDMRDNDYDGIIIAYSCFEQIPISKQYYIDTMREKKVKLAAAAADKAKSTAKVRHKEEALDKKIKEMLEQEDDVDIVTFDEMQVNRLFIDEAHNFKNVPIETQANSVLGISSGGSSKCKDMLEKVHMVQKMNDGKGVVMATGTPITNSITDAYIMQLYLQSGELALMDLQSFDGWIGMFAERVTQFEIDVDTSTYRLATRFAKFHNLAALTSMLSDIADFHQNDESSDIPDYDGHTDSLIAKTEEFAEYLKEISERADYVRKGYVDRREDNMLKITTDGRKAALDIRLVVPESLPTMQCKVFRCAENVADIYYKTAADKCTQLVFCDISTPKDEFNVYDELRFNLIRMGIPDEQIAYVHDADTEKKRTALFTKVRKGDVRIVIGSTFKLGTGVNVQDRLVAVHHLDVPWKPSDMTQREGRILRQGNTCKKVQIFRYITEGSFDAYSWQLLETKQRFITELLAGSLAENTSADIEDTVLDYAEVKALAVGNPLVKERVEAANELTRYLTLQKKLVESRLHMEAELLELPGKEKHQMQLIEKCQDDKAFYEDWKKANPEPTGTVAKKSLAEKRKELREFIHDEVINNILEVKERRILTYHGFDIILPANMKKEKPYIWLAREGRYYVELGDAELGTLVRIDNFLESFDAHIEKLNEVLNKFYVKEKDIKAELSKDVSYVDQIEVFKNKVAELDKQLGVDNK